MFALVSSVATVGAPAPSARLVSSRRATAPRLRTPSKHRYVSAALRYTAVMRAPSTRAAPGLRYRGLTRCPHHLHKEADEDESRRRHASEFVEETRWMPSSAQ